MSGADDAAHCAALVRDADFARYAAALRAPEPARRTMLALYAFDAEIARIPSQISQPLPGEMRLQWWTVLLDGLGHGGVEGHPVASELLAAIAAGVAAAPLPALLTAHIADLYNDAMPAQDALDAYLDDTEQPLFALPAALLGAEPGNADEASRAAGRARGLVRLLRELPRHAARRQCFVPQDLLAQHGTDAEALFAGQETPALRACRAEMIVLARTHLAAALDAMLRLPRDVRPAFLPIATLGRDLDALAAAPLYAIPPPPSRLAVLWAQWRLMRRCAAFRVP